MNYPWTWGGPKYKNNQSENNKIDKSTTLPDLFTFNSAAAIPQKGA